jgi:CRISPR-associated protein (TIGR02584 family)
VVTETLYALAVQSQEKFIPTEIHVISTGEGAERARLSLLDPSIGQFYALCKDYGLHDIAFPLENIHVIEDTFGNPLSDIRTPEDNLRAADYIVDFVRNFCSDTSSMLHVSIAGGRKSMGFFAGYALSLFGRTQDRLSHVLVNDPFESLPDFYFPPVQGKVLYSRNNNRPVHTSDARIMLADIPFVRLRGGIPQNLQDRKVSFHETVEEVQSGLRFISLSFDLPRKLICCGGKWIRLSPALFAFYLWLARRQVTASGNGAIHWQEADHHDFLSVYAEVVGAMSAPLENARQVLKNGFDRQYFEEKSSKINRIIKQQLPLEASFYQIATFGTRPYKRYGLKLAPDQISL